MRLSVRISLSIGVLVFIVSVSFGIISIMISAKAVEDTARDSLLRQTALGNNLFSTSLYSQLDILQELANRIDVQGMVWEDQVDDLIPVINRTGYTDMAIVGLDGRSRSIQTGTYENLADQEYVKRALAGEQAISYRLSTNNQEITQPEFIYIVPITANGTRVGALLGRKNTSTITEILGTLSQGETGYAFIMDKEGITIAHPDQALVTSQFNPLKEAASDPRSYESLAQSIRIGLESTSGFGEYTYEGKKKVVGYARITGLPWTLFVTIDDKEINAEVNRLRTIIIIFVLVFLAVGLAVAFILARDITNPIKELNKELNTEANSLTKMNFNIKIIKKRHDEIGELQNLLLIIRDNMQKKVVSLNEEVAGKQLNIASNLKKAIIHSSEGLETITNNMNSVQDKTNMQIQSVEQTSESIEEIVQHINSLENAVETQSINISRSSDSIEQMVKDTDFVLSVVHKAYDTTANLSKSSETSRKMLNQLIEELNHIAEQSTFLEQANATLVNIAAQTNILAMNAAIEAAHAGESGRGFAVVAGEIRNLAASSDKESASISNEIRKMRVGIGNIQQVSVDTADAMGAMFTEVNDMGSSFDTVNNAVAAQVANGSQILEALMTLRETTEQVRNGSGEIQKRSGLIHGTVDNLKNISKEVNDSVRDVQKTSKDIAGSLEIAKKIAAGKYLMRRE